MKNIDAKTSDRFAALREIEASFVEPMDCLSVSKLPTGSQWVWEIKLDGYRAIAVRSGSHVTLYSRRRNSLNRRFPSIVEALADLPAGTVLDGEVAAIGENGRPDFNLLQNFEREHLVSTITFLTSCALTIGI